MGRDSEETGPKDSVRGEFVSKPIVHIAGIIVAAVLLFVGGSVVSHGNRIVGLEKTTSDREQDRENWRRAEKGSTAKWRKFGKMQDHIHAVEVRLARLEGFQDGWRSRGGAENEKRSN